MMMTARSSRRPPAGPADGDGSSVVFIGERRLRDFSVPLSQDEDGSSAEDGEETVAGDPHARSGTSIEREAEEIWGEAFSQEERERLLAVGAIPGASDGGAGATPGASDEGAAAASPPPRSSVTQLPDRHDSFASLMRAAEAAEANGDLLAGVEQQRASDSDEVPLSQVVLNRNRAVESHADGDQQDDRHLQPMQQKSRAHDEPTPKPMKKRKKRKVRDARGKCQRGCPRPRTCCHRGRGSKVQGPVSGVEGPRRVQIPVRGRGGRASVRGVSGKGVDEQSLPASAAAAAEAEEEVAAEAAAAAEEPGGAPAAPRKKKRKARSAVVHDDSGAAVQMQPPTQEPAAPSPSACPAPSSAPSVSNGDGLPTDVQMMIGGARAVRPRKRRRAAAPSSACGSARHPETPKDQIGVSQQRTSRRGLSCKLGAGAVSSRRRRRGASSMRHR